MPITSDAIVLMAVCAGVGSAAVVDVANRRIPNQVALATAAAGVALAVTGLSGVTLGASLAGFAMGFVMMLPGHIIGGTGAGDVKLFAAAGAVLGLERILAAFCFMAIAGGVLAVCVAWRRGRLLRTLAATARLCGRPLETRRKIESPAEHNRFPYGPAIAVGCVLAVIL